MLDNTIVLRPVILQHLYLKLSSVSGILRSRVFGVRSGNMEETGQNPRGERTKKMKLKVRKKAEQKL